MGEMMSWHGKLNLTAAVIAALVVTACAGVTPTPLTHKEFEALNIVSVEVKTTAATQITWLAAEEEFAEKHGGQGGPAAHGYVREKAGGVLKKALAAAFESGPRGPRKTRLEVTITKVEVADAGAKIVGSLMGGSFHSLTAEAVFIDAQTGAVIARTREVGAVEHAGGFGLTGAVAGMIRDEVEGEPYGRLAANYAQGLRNWLLPGRR
jgi:hypothetical protein